MKMVKCNYNVAKGFVPFYGLTNDNGDPLLMSTNYCKLDGDYGCSGFLGPPMAFVNQVKKYLIKNNMKTPSGVKITDKTHFGVGVAPPLMIGNSSFSYAQGTTGYMPTYQGQTNNSGVLYENENDKGGVAIVLLVDMPDISTVLKTENSNPDSICGTNDIKYGCKDLVGMSINDQLVSKEGGECLQDWWAGKLKDENVRPICPCLGSVQGIDDQEGGQCCGNDAKCCGKDASKYYRWPDVQIMRILT